MVQLLPGFQPRERFEGELGEGSMGAVYRDRHQDGIPVQ